MSAALFNSALEYALRKIDKDIITTKAEQIITYSDDPVIISKDER